MNRIVAPISVGNSGPQTANLQDALRLLLVRGVIPLVVFPSHCCFTSI